MPSQRITISSGGKRAEFEVVEHAARAYREPGLWGAVARTIPARMTRPGTKFPIA